MEVIRQIAPGSLHICDNCYALLAYNPSDVYEGHFIYCPVCKKRQKCNMDLEWDGTIK